MRTEGEKVAAAVEELAHAAGGLAGLAHAVGAVAGGAVRGASAVAGGIATVMAACHGEEYMPTEEPTQESPLPPPYFVSVLLSLCYTSHQPHIQMQDIANNDFALREPDKLQV